MNLYLCGGRSFGATVFDALRDDHHIVGVSSPVFHEGGQSTVEQLDRLHFKASQAGVPWMPAGTLNAETLPSDVDLIVAAHAHDFIGRRTLLKARLGGVGYHPSLLPRHRGRDAVKWTIHMGDPVAGGTVYWLSQNVDAGDIAAQDWCWVKPGDTASELWRRDLYPMGVRLIRKVVDDLAAGVLVAIPQDEDVATWEPSWDRPPLRRPDLLLLGDGLEGMRVVRERSGV